MHKKTYITLFITGTFILVSLLPLFNYSVDRWRVLHSDYAHYYAGQAPNKTFLKTKYLIEHPKQAQALLMGSSNGGYIDANRIEKNMYNMKYNFGLLSIHLQNIKTMLKEGVKIKTLWVGINDYIIWKDPKDYYESFERSPYKADVWKDLNTYMFYLFRKPEMMDWYLFTGRYRLLKSEIITNPHPHTEAKKREEAHLKDPEEWKVHMRQANASLLRYDDTNYRIDKAIEEIRALKNLCEKNDIKLTLFIYPAFYKTYLAYNQEKMETFKAKLATVMPYYDFYRLDDNAYDALKWQDSMHFVYSRGNAIVDAIKEKQNLVTNENIKKHLKELKEEAYKHLELQKGIYTLHPSLLTGSTTTLFDLNKPDVSYTNVTKQFRIKRDNAHVTMDILGDDPELVLPSMNIEKEKTFLSLALQSPHKVLFRIYYKEKLDDPYSEIKTVRYTLHKGMNRFAFALPTKYIKNGLRINLSNRKGTYKIETFKLSY